MELQHFSHNHPLVFNEERNLESDQKVYCSGCEEEISGPMFSCVTCGFHLDKNCAMAPSEINHHFHRNHSLHLLSSLPYGAGTCVCNFCDKDCKKFVYHCSCDLDLHIGCALFLYDIAERKIGDQLQWIENKDPSISTENHTEKLIKAKCFACWKPLLDSAYLSLDSGFCLHKKCAELPLETNYPRHRQHSLFLQFNSHLVPCKTCKVIQSGGLVYCCSICNFVLHIECVSQPPIIEDTSSHEHPFTRLLLRQSSFTCDACGASGNYVSYICLTCSLIVHKKCTSLPRIIKSIWHHHPVFHKYSVVDNECGALACVICHEINKECGSYYCSDCKFILHVNCALQDPWWYYKIESRDAFEKLNQNGADNVDPSFSVIKEIRHGENVMNTEMKHFSHEHNLILHDEVKDHKCCDGCSQLIETSFYGCLQCDFFLHNSCAELPRKKQIWIQVHQHSFNLIADCVYMCGFCNFVCSGFSYKCKICDDRICVRCAGLSPACTSQGHNHPLLFYLKYSGQYCNACGDSIDNNVTYRCKDCDFNVHYRCILLPQTACHKCDEHILTLTCNEDNDYSEYHYCDICEEERSPNNWFYYCAVCDNKAHPKCVLGDHPYVKRGTNVFIESEHPHSLVFVQKVYPYPECCKCGQPCLDLALECGETRCTYIVHFTCVEQYSYFGRKANQIRF
ncbi:uncharacterized protein LOC111297614 [Durio zibethinus]|uniref:Uncharacterized protein LOC111297614 n=1 Tax=Durio zibethinus TaxID=66656 RepID=A0A6P5Z5K8_DURZI|nr:uncharacterized protein LOC111297614 [Durio zibethinus]